MTKRRFLSLAVAAIGIAGAAFASVPFIKSMGPSARARAAYEMHIPLQQVPTSNFVEVDWNGQKVFLGRFPDVRAFLMPHWNGNYYLPDLSWQRAVIPCGSFAFRAESFRCLDSGMEPWWQENAQWTAEGASPGQYMPPLQKPPYVVRGGEVILGLDE